MGAANVHVVNQTTRPLKLKIGNQLVFSDLTTVEQHTAYKMKVDCSSSSSTFREYLLALDGCSQVLVVSAHEFKGTGAIVIKEDEGGAFSVQVVSSSRRARRIAARRSSKLCCSNVKSSFWRFWQSQESCAHRGK